MKKDDKKDIYTLVSGITGVSREDVKKVLAFMSYHREINMEKK